MMQSRVKEKLYIERLPRKKSLMNKDWGLKIEQVWLNNVEYDLEMMYSSSISTCKDTSTRVYHFFLYADTYTYCEGLTALILVM